MLHKAYGQGVVVNWPICRLQVNLKYDRVNRSNIRRQRILNCMQAGVI